MKRIHHTDNDIIKVKQYFNQPKEFKPIGLWYDIDNSWTEWCKRNMPDWTYKNHFELEIDESKILIIDTKEKLLYFDKQYSINISKRGSICVIDWESVSKKYSGIEISPYRYDCRFSLFWYYGFDIASGCIWNFDCINSINKINNITDGLHSIK